MSEEQREASPYQTFRKLPVIQNLADQLPRRSLNSLISIFFFIFSGVAAFWLVWIVIEQGFETRWGWLFFLIPLWAIIAYVALPRLHRIMTSIYVPDYFIGRTRTTDGLLGDPVNLAIRGSQDQLETAMQCGGWTKADEITLRSSWRIITSTLMRKSYHEAPVSTLMLFGRQQDFAYQQEVEGNPAKRHHVRFWRCPEDWYLPGGFKVDWLAAGTFDKSVGLSIFTFQVTHKIDENIDLERDHIVKTLLDAGPEVSVENVEHYTTGYHSRNGGGDQIITDGTMPIVDLDGLEPDPAIVASHPADRAVVPGTDVEVPALERPITTIFGAAFSFISGLSAVIAGIIEFAATAREDVDAPMVLGIYLAIGIAQIVIAIFVWLGKNWARVTQMALTSVSIVLAYVAQSTGSDRITFGPTLFEVALEIFAVLALSSQSAQAFARHRRY